jgi:hypothetical protein
MMRSLLPAVLVFASCAWPQTACPPIEFQTGYVASLTPTSSSHLKQADGSYPGVELANSPPYQILSTTPNYRKQVMATVYITIQ